MTNRTSGDKFEFREELKLVPKAIVAVAALVFVGMQALFLLVVFRHDLKAPHPAWQVLIAAAVGSIAAFFLLLIGYINRDAKRRGMNYVLWTVLVLVIPNGIGYIIYFILRQPVLRACPHCGVIVNPTFNFCPNCKFNLHPVCPQCHHSISVGASFCPYCSTELTSTANH